MKKSFPHDLDTPTSKKVAEHAFAAYAERFAEYNPNMNWSTDTHADFGFTAKGLALKGTMDLRDGEVEVELNVPLLLKPFRKKAMSVIETEMEKWIDKANKGELE
jgi:hypothetical protein